MLGGRDGEIIGDHAFFTNRLYTMRLTTELP
jgi:hypothetical protein